MWAQYVTALIYLSIGAANALIPFGRDLLQCWRQDSNWCCKDRTYPEFRERYPDPSTTPVESFDVTIGETVLNRGTARETRVPSTKTMSVACQDTRETIPAGGAREWDRRIIMSCTVGYKADLYLDDLIRGRVNRIGLWSMKTERGRCIEDTEGMKTRRAIGRENYLRKRKRESGLSEGDKYQLRPQGRRRKDAIVEAASTSARPATGRPGSMCVDLATQYMATNPSGFALDDIANARVYARLLSDALQASQEPPGRPYNIPTQYDFWPGGFDSGDKPPP